MRRTEFSTGVESRAASISFRAGLAATPQLSRRLISLSTARYFSSTCFRRDRLTSPTAAPMAVSRRSALSWRCKSRYSDRLVIIR